jgi:hypothetical protein
MVAAMPDPFNRYSSFAVLLAAQLLRRDALSDHGRRRASVTLVDFSENERVLVDELRA